MLGTGGRFQIRCSTDKLIVFPNSSMHEGDMGENNMLTIVTKTPAPTEDWGALVAQIRAGDEAGSEKLYRIFSRGLRFYLIRQLEAQDCEDKEHEIFAIVLRAVRKGNLREPERLMGFVRTVARRQVASYIEARMHSRQKESDLDSGAQIAEGSPNPEAQALLRERIEIVRDALACLSERDRQILTRFYFHEETPEQICKEMKLTETQFRLLKSRAKERFAVVGKLRTRKPVAATLKNLMPGLMAGRASA
jgi:RNA polymerase sigma-70 factor, ECF subfamily